MGTFSIPVRRLRGTHGRVTAEFVAQSPALTPGGVDFTLHGASVTFQHGQNLSFIHVSVTAGGERWARWADGRASWTGSEGREAHVIAPASGTSPGLRRPAWAGTDHAPPPSCSPSQRAPCGAPPDPPHRGHGRRAPRAPPSEQGHRRRPEPPSLGPGEVPQRQRDFPSQPGFPRAGGLGARADWRIPGRDPGGVAFL